MGCRLLFIFYLKDPSHMYMILNIYGQQMVTLPLLTKLMALVSDLGLPAEARLFTLQHSSLRSLPLLVLLAAGVVLRLLVTDEWGALDGRPPRSPMSPLLRFWRADRGSFSASWREHRVPPFPRLPLLVCKRLWCKLPGSGNPGALFSRSTSRRDSRPSWDAVASLPPRGPPS